MWLNPLVYRERHRFKEAKKLAQVFQSPSAAWSAGNVRRSAGECYKNMQEI
jgi:hypothetical protein